MKGMLYIGGLGGPTELTLLLTDTLKVRGQMQKKNIARAHIIYMYVYTTHLLAEELQSFYIISLHVH